MGKNSKADPLVILTAFVVIVMAFSAVNIQGANDSDASTNISITSNGVDPWINYVNLTQGGLTLLDGSSGNVNNNAVVTVNVTVPNSWEYLDYINVSAWFDEGDDANGYGDVSGANYKWKLEYSNTSGSGSWNLVSTHANNEVQLQGSTLGFQNSTTRNWTVTIYWNSQVKHANGNNVGPSYTNGGWTELTSEGSWNIQWDVECEDPTNSATQVSEFGISQYVSVTATGDVTGSGDPGESVTFEDQSTMESSVTFESNDKFNLSVDLNDLTDGSGHTIGKENAYVKTNWGDGIGSYTSLSNTVFLNSATPHGAYRDGVSTTFNTQWRIDIPFGTYPTTYDSTITYNIETAGNVP